MFICNFDTILIDLPGPLAVRFYGLAYLLAFFLAFLLVPYALRLQNHKFDKARISDLVFYIFLSMLIGARLGHFIFYSPQTFLTNPLEVLYLWHGGMSFHGGLIGVVLACVFLAPKYKLPRLLLGDVLILPSLLALFLGRLANFINCELPGRVADLPWSVIFPRFDSFPRHPAVLYEATLYLVISVFLFFYLRSRPRIGNPFFAGLLLLGLARFINEFFREPDYFVYSWFTVGQVLTLPLIFLSVYFIFLGRYCHSEQAKSSQDD